MTNKSPQEIQREAFSKKDRLIRGITKDGFLKIAVVKATDVIQEAKRRHELSLLSTVILGRAMIGAMLLAADLKGEERIHARFEGKGPLGSVNVEANHAGEMRGYVRNPQAEIDLTKGETLADGLGIGLLHYTKVLFRDAQPVTGVVALPYSNITGDYAHYLLHSEQIPSAILIDVGIDEDGEVSEAVGILVQALPHAPIEHIEIIEKNFDKIKALSTLLLDGMSIEELMHHVLRPLPAKELKRGPVHFFCRCSRERFKDLLITIGSTELQEMQNEPQELVCQYCNEQYIITPSEIKELIQGLQ